MSSAENYQVRSVNITINSGVFSKQHTSCICYEAYLTLRPPITKEADGIMKYVFYCSEKIGFDISCEMEIIHNTSSLIFSEKKRKKKRKRMSLARILYAALRVEPF